MFSKYCSSKDVRPDIVVQKEKSSRLKVPKNLQVLTRNSDYLQEMLNQLQLLLNKISVELIKYSKFYSCFSFI